jgi:nucleoid DNA-binding protein
MAKAKAPAKPVKALTKSAFFAQLADASGLKKTEVVALYAALVTLVGKEVKKTNKFILPDLAKFSLKHVPAVKGGEKKVNPLTKEEYVTKPKKAHNKVRVSPVKKLKDAVM